MSEYKADMLLCDYKRHVLLPEYKFDVLLPEYQLDALLPDYSADVLLPDSSSSVGFIENAKFEILTALLLTIQVCLCLLQCHCVSVC
jgi:hypothetical protein